MMSLEHLSCIKTFTVRMLLIKWRLEKKTKERIQSSARRCFECLLRLFMIGTLAEAASRVPQEVRTLLFSR